MINPAIDRRPFTRLWALSFISSDPTEEERGSRGSLFLPRSKCGSIPLRGELGGR